MLTINALIAAKTAFQPNLEEEVQNAINNERNLLKTLKKMQNIKSKSLITFNKNKYKLPIYSKNKLINEFFEDKFLINRILLIIEKLKEHNIDSVGDFFYLSYDSPYKFYGRRNEVIIAVNY